MSLGRFVCPEPGFAVVGRRGAPLLMQTEGQDEGDTSLCRGKSQQSPHASQDMSGKHWAWPGLLVSPSLQSGLRRYLLHS